MKKYLFAAVMLLCLATAMPPAHALAISLFPRTSLTVHHFDDVFVDINVTGLHTGGLDRALGAYGPATAALERATRGEVDGGSFIAGAHSIR